MGYVEIFLIFVSFLLLFWFSFRNKNGLPTKWPVVGMLPAILKNHYRIHDFVAEITEKSKMTFRFKGPWFTNMNLLFTTEPSNVQHVLSKNFGNYPKGPKFYEVFEILGDGIFNTDWENWKFHRKMVQSFLSHPRFDRFLLNTVREKIDTGLIPILDHVSKQGSEIDLQDLFGRITFDVMCNVIMDYDPRTLSIDLPNFPVFKALEEAEVAILYRHIVPTCVWKFLRWLDVGLEKKYKEASKIGDEFSYECISKKREEMSKNSELKACKEQGIDLISLYMDEVKENAEITSNGTNKLIRDTIVSFLAAGRDTTSVALSWLFYLLSKNQHVLSKVKEELDAVIVQEKDYHHNHDHDFLLQNFNEFSDKLIYLHATICESLRLYPPVAFNAKTPIEPDTLPSGHQVDSSTQIIFSMYAMGRTKSIWGEDCYEFKPERWISETGKIKYEPSHKFLAFHTGPRTCLGKAMSLIVMKATTISLINRYHFEPVEGHPIVPHVSFILEMKHGFKVKVSTH